MKIETNTNKVDKEVPALSKTSTNSYRQKERLKYEKKREAVLRLLWLREKN